MLSILPLNTSLIPFLNQADSRYLVGEAVSLKLTRQGFTLDYLPMPKAEWRVWHGDGELFSAQELIDMPDMACFIALWEGQPVGQAMVMQHFNRLAMVFDVQVDVALRRAGIGEELIAACRDWARRQGLGGLVVETTDSNPGACQFFEKCGFQLGGVDRMRYGALPEQSIRPAALRDCAMTFYQLF